jgi:hypothetical protein
VRSDLAREELHKKFTLGKEIAAKRHAKQNDKEADSYERQGAKHAKAQNANLMDNISRSSAQESADSHFEKFSIPEASRKFRSGVRSVTRMRLEDNQDSIRSQSEDDSYLNRYNDNDSSSPIGIAS